MAGSNRDDVLAGMQEFARCVKDGVADALERLLGHGFEYVHAHGAIEPGSRFVKRMRAGGEQLYKRLDFEDVTIARYGDVAVATGIARVGAVLGPEAARWINAPDIREGRWYREIAAYFTAIWLEADGALRLVRYHSTLQHGGFTDGPSS